MRLLFTSLVFSLLFSAAAANELRIGESTYQPSCSNSEWIEIDERLHVAAFDRFPDQLVELIKTYVCDGGPEAEHVLQRYLPERVRQVISGTGDTDIFEFVLAKTIFPKEGKAWGLEVHDKGSDIAITFFVDEACAHETVFRPYGKSWLLVQVTDACD